MIPLRDTAQSRNYPVINNTIIAINIFFFLIELSKGHGLDQFIQTYGLVPARYSVPEIGALYGPGQQAICICMSLYGNAVTPIICVEAVHPRKYLTAAS